MTGTVQKHKDRIRRRRNRCRNEWEIISHHALKPQHKTGGLGRAQIYRYFLGRARVFLLGALCARMQAVAIFSLVQVRFVHIHLHVNWVRDYDVT
jgi:hypothetical protein